MLQKDLIKTAYPKFDQDKEDSDSYYLLRLGSLWGEELLNEYIDAMETHEPKQSGQNRLNYGYQLDLVPA